jgi:hypothetical protein
MDRRSDGTGGWPAVVTIGEAAAEVRRAVGPTAWCALEVLAGAPVEVDERWIVRSSVREVAVRLGVATNTAQRALAALREAGVIAAGQGRDCSGRFGSGAYRLAVDANVLSRPAREPIVASTPTPSSRPRVAAKPAADRSQQLELLPSA